MDIYKIIKLIILVIAFSTILIPILLYQQSDEMRMGQWIKLITLEGIAQIIIKLLTDNKNSLPKTKDF